MPFPIGRNVFVMVNTSMLGLNETERLENYQIHPMIRNNWRCDDRLQDTFLYPPALYVDEEGVQRAYETVAENGVASKRPWRAPDECGALMAMEGGVPQASTFINGILTGHPVPQQNLFEIEFSNSSWNAYCVEPYMDTDSASRLVDFLEYEGKDTLFAGIPYFVRYFADSRETPNSPGLVPNQGRFHPATETVSPIMNDNMFSTDDGIKYFYNHKFKHAVTDHTVPENVGNIEINPVYNFYLNTSPGYEPTVAEFQIPAAMLPNYYMLEGNYKYAPQNDGQMPYEAEVVVDEALGEDSSPQGRERIAEIFSGTSPEDSSYPLVTSAGYYQYYTQRISELDDDDQLSAKITDYLSIYKNVAVLTPEIGGGFFETYNEMVRNKEGESGYGGGTAKTSDDLFAINTYPFYNEIIIPHAQQYYSDDNYFDSVAAAGATDAAGAEQLLTLLQLLAIWRWETGVASSGPTGLSASADEPMRMTKWETSATPANTVVEDSTVVDVVFHLEDLLGGLNDLDANTDAAASLSNLVDLLKIKYNRGSRGSTSILDTVILRDGFADDISPEGNDPDAYYFKSANFSSTLSGFLAGGAKGIRERFHTFRKLFKNHNGQYRDSEAIMYIVEKRVIPPGQTVVASDDPSTVVQTLFFGKDITPNRPFTSRKGVHYYDTQIQYGVRYQYDIKQLRLVFGNKYYYDASETETIVNSLEVGQARALGNALGLFAPEIPHRTGTNSYASIASDGLTSYAPSTDTTNGVVRPEIKDNPFPFVQEGDEGPWAANGQQLGGNYIYLWDGISNKTAELRGAFEFSGVNDDLVGVDFNLIMLKVQLGSGFDGYNSGGLIPGSPPPEAPGEDAQRQFYTGVGEYDLMDEIQEVEQENNLDLVDALNKITEVLGAEISDEVESWVANGGPPAVLQVLDVVYAAGADPSEGQGGWGGDQGMEGRNIEAGLNNIGATNSMAGSGAQNQQGSGQQGVGGGQQMGFESFEGGFGDLAIDMDIEI